MKRPTTWVIVALSVVVLVQGIIIFRVWPAEYTYHSFHGFPVRVHRGDNKTEMWRPGEGWDVK